MDTTRLRKTFQFQGDDGDEEPLAMDEQEQEELIAKLKKENDDKNALYLQLFLIVPCVSCLLFLFGFIRASGPSARLMCILGTTSLLATAYNLLFIPTKQEASRVPVRVGTYELPPAPDSLGPAQRYIPALNAALSVLIALWSLTLRNSQSSFDTVLMIICWMPLFEFTMIQMARIWIVEVDPSELEKLKYEFKGA